MIISFEVHQSFSQCSMYEVPLVQRIQNSTAIIEGKVLSKYSFWNIEHTLIFTSNSIEVYKVFKGNSVGSQIELITEGGIVGDKKHVVEPSLQLNSNDIGIFFVEPSLISDPSKSSLNNVFMAYGSSQGFVKYNLEAKTANDPFKKYRNIETELYNSVENQTKHTPLIMKAFDVNASQSNFNLNKSITTAPSISSFSPSTITAGTGSILTINGSGFGATQSTSVVSFSNADDGGGTYIQPAPSQYVSWSDTQIKVKVPTKTSSSGTAGTGNIQVTVGGSTGTSGSSLTISYAELNVISSGIVYQTDHINGNGTGGYTWQMFTGFDANANAKAAFTRAFGTWRCGTFINWQIGSTTSVNTIGSDGTNVIRFDIGSELPVGVLGRCSSYWSGCGTGVWYVTELDIAFDDITNWNYSTNQPTGAQSDFESVALHELGHGHQLTHVNNTLDVMNWALTQGTSRRVLNIDDINGGNDVMSRNIVNNSCGPTHMIALTSGNCAIGSPTADFSATPTSSCSAPLTVIFTDQSVGSPTSWAWDINNDGITDYTTQSPTHTYTIAGTYAVKLIATNTNGSNTIIKTNYITVGSAALPFTEDFENATFPPSGWSIAQSPVDSKTWTRNTTALGNGTSTACATIDYFYYSTVGGEKDNLISKPVSLVGVNTASMTFKVAYKYYANIANYDSLRVFISTDCGVSYGPAVYAQGGSGLATSGSSSNEFTPAVSGDWRTETVSLNSFVGNNIIVKFEGTNHYGNDVYLDDINITGSTLVAPVAKFIASDTTLCVGQCITFTDQSTNTPASWAWTFTGASTTSSTAQSPTSICYNTAGTYNVSLISTNGGGSNTKTKTGYIVVSALPTAPTITQSGNTLTSSTALSYQWKLNGAAISGATSISYNATVSGIYTVVIMNAGGCSATSSALNVTTTGIDAFADGENGVTIYPNPFSTSAIIKIQPGKAVHSSEMNFILYDLIGNEVIRINNMNEETPLFRNQLSDGLYLYKVFYKNQLIGKGKVIVQ